MATTLYHNGQATMNYVDENGKQKTVKVTLPEGATFGGRPVRQIITVTDPEEAKALRAKGFDAPTKTVKKEAEREAEKAEDAKAEKGE